MAERPSSPFASSNRFLPPLSPQRDVGVAAVAGQVRERLGHEGRAQAVLLGDRLHHVFEEGVPVGGL